MTASTQANSKFQRFAKFKDGWRFGMGKAFSSDVLMAIQQLLERVLQAGFQHDLFPGEEGELTISIYVGGKNHDFTVFPGGKVELLIEDDVIETEYQSCITVNEALERINNLKSHTV